MSLAVLALTCAAAAAADHPASACADQPDASARLACYDRFFHDADAGAASGPTPVASEAVQSPLVARTAPAPDAPSSRLWELAPADKRGTFSVRTYRANYLLPVHYTSSQRVPMSPTHAAPADPDDLQRVEAKFQVSLRAKALEDVVLPGADLWLAYTQVSMWQIYNHAASSPFRNSDYEPEAIFVVPLGDASGVGLPGDWRWRMVQFGVAHQSNGQGGLLSRSWNRVWVGAGFEHDAIGLQLRVHQRVRFSSSADDNPDLERYIGRGELLASFVTEGTAATLTWRTGSGFLKRGSLQIDWSYPVRRSQPEGLRWYVQAFTGYGETLLDYNHRQTSVGAGFALFQF